MSDGEGEEAYDDAVVEGYEEDGGGGGGFGGGGDEDSGPLNPCAACGLGLVLLVLSVMGLWMNEGAFVRTIQALDAVNERFVSPCSDDCSSCNFDKVEDAKTGKMRALAPGDDVYMACGVQGLKDVGESLKEKFPVKELTGILQGADDGEKAASFVWRIEMFQEFVEPGTAQIPNLTAFQNGKFKNNPNAFCAYKRPQVCDKSAPMSSWTRGTPGTGPAPAVPTTTTAPTHTTSTEPESECKELPRKACDEKTDKCTWDYPKCSSTTVEEECRKLEPVECQWAATPITVKDKECKGCCPTDNTWKVACKPKTQGVEAAQNLAAWSFQEQVVDEEGEGPQEEEEEERVLHSLRGNPSAVPARRLKGTCTWKTCRFFAAYRNEIMQTPATWEALPSNGTGSVKYVNQPAYNLKELSSSSAKETGVWLGAKGSSASQGMGLGAIFREVFEGSYRSVDLKRHDSTGVLASTKEVATPFTLKSDPSRTMDLIELDRSASSAAWTAENSVTTKDGCLQSSSGKSGPQVGDLRACFKRSTTTQISVIAQATRDKDGWQLVASPDVGLLLRRDAIVPPEALIKEKKDAAGFLLKALRIILPLLMWLGFYCCLSPLVWVIDQFGDAIGSVPCVGDFLGGMVEIVETLADCAICVVSCCGALACSLLVGSVAWVWFRPQVGIPLLIVSLALFAGLTYFGTTRKGAEKVRRRRSTAQSSAREVRGSSVEMRSPAASAQPLQFAVVCPEGVAPGGLVQVQAPDGRMVQVQVPDGVVPGQQFLVMA